MRFESNKTARFWMRLLRLTRGRIAILRALEVIAQEEDDHDFRQVIVALRGRLDDGASLCEAVAGHPDVFSLSVCELVRAAERTGAWDEILQEIHDGLRDGTFD